MFEVEKKYIIVDRFNLPWQYVSPTSLTGLEFHLSEDVSIKMDGITSGNIQFVIGNEILALENYKVEGDLEQDFTFRMNILSMKNKERVSKVFSSGDDKLSCFLNERQMEAFQKLFDENHFICSDITVSYKNTNVSDIHELPQKEFNLVLGIFEQFNVLGVMDYKSSNRDLSEEYAQALNEKVARAADDEKKGNKKKVKGKVEKKDIALGVLAMVLSSIGFVAKHMLVKRTGMWSGILAVAFSCLSIVGNAISYKQTQKMV